MNDWTKCDAVERDPARMSGAWVFTGTRVPVSALFENLRDGASVSDFLDWFPGVTRDQMEAVLDAKLKCPEPKSRESAFRPGDPGAVGTLSRRA
ncbi:MAG: DUF433 domain-containing protein [Planctomycetaceae bacterium]